MRRAVMSDTVTGTFEDVALGEARIWSIHEADKASACPSTPFGGGDYRLQKCDTRGMCSRL